MPVNKAILFAVVLFCSLACSSMQADTTTSRNIRYHFLVSNPTPKLVESAELVVFAPNDETRQIQIKNLPPFGSRTVLIKETVNTGERNLRFDSWSKNAAKEDSSWYLISQKYIESDAPAVKKAAKVLKGASPTSTTKKTYDFVTTSLERSKPRGRVHGALWALTNRVGDCTEHACLTAALLRANEVPCRVVTGFVVQKNMVLEPSASHDWTEVLVAGRWRVVDCFANNFMKDEENYIAFRTLRPGAGLSGVDNHYCSVHSLNPDGLTKYKISNPELIVKMKGTY